MSNYVIGDLHGCADELERLLDQLKFDPAEDRLWFTGDLINRGPQSLKTLRLVHSLDDSALTVLGNHDLHLLGCWQGLRKAKSGDTVDEILEAHDGEQLCHWLRRQPFLHRDGKYVLVHAGLYPGWDMRTCEKRAQALESALAGKHYAETLKTIFSAKAPISDRVDLSTDDRLRLTAAAFTRMRFVHPQSLALNMAEKGPPETRSAEAIPWFEAAAEQFQAYRVFTGHWAALGHRQTPWLSALDSGCMWGGKLTAVTREQPSQSCCVDCSHLQRLSI